MEGMNGITSDGDGEVIEVNLHIEAKQESDGEREIEKKAMIAISRRQSGRSEDVYTENLQ